MSNATSAPSWTDGMTYTASTDTATKVRQLTGGAWELYSQEAENGFTELRLGNNIASGSQYSSYASLKMYNKSSGYHYIEATDTNTGYFTHKLPANDGILVTTNGTPSAAIGSSTKPVYVSASGVITECGELNQLIVFKNYTSTSTSCNAGSVVSYYGSTNSSNPYFQFSTPSGYRPLCFTKIMPSSANISVQYFDATSTGAGCVRVRNNTTSNVSSFTTTVRIAYIKTGYSADV